MSYTQDALHCADIANRQGLFRPFCEGQLIAAMLLGRFMATACRELVEDR